MYYIYSKPKTGIYLTTKKTEGLILLKSLLSLDNALDYIHKSTGWDGSKLTENVKEERTC